MRSSTLLLPNHALTLEATSPELPGAVLGPGGGP